MLKDFNIEEEAGGTGKPVVKNFTVVLTTHTLKILFYWAGRGTTGIPARGMYGPIISAISVVPSKLKPNSRNSFIVHSVISFATIDFFAAKRLDHTDRISPPTINSTGLYI